MQNKDLFVNVSVNSSIGDNQHPPQHHMTKYQKQRAHLLPLGGMMGERAAKFMTLYDGGFEGAGKGNSLPSDSMLPSPQEDKHKTSASAIRRGARMSLDMSPGTGGGSIKLDARRASMELLPQRHAIFSIAAMGGGDQELRKSSFVQPQKVDPMAKT